MRRSDKLKKFDLVQTLSPMAVVNGGLACIKVRPRL